MTPGDPVWVSTMAGRVRGKILRSTPLGSFRVLLDDGRQRTVKAGKLEPIERQAAPVPELAPQAVVDYEGATERLPIRPVPKEVMARSKPYMAHIRAQCCCACQAEGPSDPHHYGPRGMGQKTDDLRCVPLCRRCHDEFHAYGAIPSAQMASKAAVRVHFAETQVKHLIHWIKKASP